MDTILSREQVEETVCRLAAEQVAMARAEVDLDTGLFSDLNFDSLNVVEFMMEIEDAFDVSIPDEQAEQIRTVREVVELLQAQLENRRAAQT